MKWPVKAVPCSIPNRFVLIDKETGEIVDDCQGYGFKTEKKAYACWAYKNRDKEQEKEIKLWLKSHKSFVKSVNELARRLESMGNMFSVEDMENQLYEKDIKVDFSIKDMYYIWRRRRLHWKH